MRGSLRQGRRTQRGAAFFAALGLIGTLACTTIGPSLSQRSAKAAGPYPTDFRETVNEWIERDFFDLAYVRSLEVSTPIPGMAKGLFDTEPTFGWFSRVVFRGTDGIGTSTGKLYYSVLIRDDQVVASRKHSY